MRYFRQQLDAKGFSSLLQKIQQIVWIHEKLSYGDIFYSGQVFAEEKPIIV
jgi:hypothetical protein